MQILVKEENRLSFSLKYYLSSLLKKMQVYINV